MLKQLIFLLALSAIFTPASAQVRVSGKVTDAATGLALPYVSIRVPNTSIGTSSNAEGEFELFAPILAKRLLFSQLGYRTDTLRLLSGSPTVAIQLRPAPIMLPEVRVPNFVENLLTRAYRVLLRDNATHHYGQAFYRQITRLGGESTEVQEQVWHVETSNAGIVGTALLQGRYAVKKSLVNFSNFSVNTKGNIDFLPDADSTETKSFIGPNAGKYYTLSLVGIEQRGEQQVAEISFVKKDKTQSGSVVVNTATGQLLRLKGHVPDFNSTFGDSAPNLRKGELDFEYAFLPGDRTAILNYIRTTYTATVARPTKSTLPVQVSTFAFFYDIQPTPVPGVVYAKLNRDLLDLASIRQTTYDPDYWKNNSVVKRTPIEEEVIKSFERGKAFGTMLNK